MAPVTPGLPKLQRATVTQAASANEAERKDLVSYTMPGGKETVAGERSSRTQA